MLRTKVLLASTLAAATLLLTTSPASAALPPDINGSRISWSSSYPCFDGSNGTDVYTQPRYQTPLAGWYHLRVAVYRSDGARLYLNPMRESYSVAGGQWLSFNVANYSTAYTGETYVVGYVYRWSGTAWQLVARESLGCW